AVVARALSWSAPAGAAIAVFLALMVCAPLLTHYLERRDLGTAARAAAWIGYTWMGVAFLFFCSSLAVGAYNAVAGVAAGLFSAPVPGGVLSPRASLAISALATLALALYAGVEAYRLRLERITFATPRMPHNPGTVRIAQISDVHLGLMGSAGRLERLLRILRACDPDILVSTGDLVDARMDGLAPLARRLREFQTRLGKYAVTGNHEFYAGIDQALAFTRQAGFTVLRGEAVSVAGLINIAGVDDPAAAAWAAARTADDSEVLASLPRDRFTVLLKHRPVVTPGCAGRFDLQLSGHTHKGQIFPFSLITRLSYPAHSGLRALGRDAYLYVSRGTGTWGPPFRLLAPPEVTLIDIHYDAAASPGPRMPDQRP
ncbi:MAG: metallophosphoesterase, partial [Gammaproteobacteria bacterium]|nr:metallophosphoesterase [Gammaproteobacteria bacterium]